MPFVSRSRQSSINSLEIKSYRYLENNDSAIQSSLCINAICNYSKFVCVCSDRINDRIKDYNATCITYAHSPVRIITRARMIPRNNFYRKNLYRSLLESRSRCTYFSDRRCYTTEMRMRRILGKINTRESPTNVSDACMCASDHRRPAAGVAHCEIIAFDTRCAQAYKI